ncbi:hypothetical protein CVT26_009968 [Gymnopilus dilepis]|uniref:Uncharacterized protein n=1 Tax=Gymnopilus dilepis TaxID=231916 RepID=A0A409VL61_9AGAR|nr:hypothetical protein CVT26_009968 [Gymnopilus dilepis]
MAEAASLHEGVRIIKSKLAVLESRNTDSLSGGDPPTREKKPHVGKIEKTISGIATAYGLIFTSKPSQADLLGLMLSNQLV